MIRPNSVAPLLTKCSVKLVCEVKDAKCCYPHNLKWQGGVLLEYVFQREREINVYNLVVSAIYNGGQIHLNQAEI